MALFASSKSLLTIESLRGVYFAQVSLSPHSLTVARYIARSLVRSFELDRQQLVRLLQPLFWRHAKADVAAEINLPPQQEEVIRLSLSPIERTYYDKLYQQCMSELESLHDDSASEKIKGRIVASMLLLRQSCCHPQVGAHGTTLLGTKARSMDELLDFMLKQASDEMQQAMLRMSDLYLQLAACAHVSHQPLDAFTWYQKARDISAAEVAAKRTVISDIKLRTERTKEDDDKLLALRLNFSAWVDRDIHALHQMLKLSKDAPVPDENWHALIIGMLVALDLLHCRVGCPMCLRPSRE